MSSNFKNIRTNGFVQCLFFGVMGGAFLWMGYSDDFLFGEILGMAFLAYAIYVGYRTFRFPKIEDEKRAE